MSLTFADTHNMVAYLNKSDASEGFDQVVDFLNASYIKYARTINPHIYVSCIKQFCNTVVVKQSNDVTRLQALIDKKKVVITEATIRDALRLDDAEGVDCLPNEEIFAELARVIEAQGDAEKQVQDDVDDAAAQGADTDRIDSLDDNVMEDASNQGRMIDALDSDASLALMDDKEEEKKAKEAKVVGDDQVKGRQAEIYQIDMDHASKVLSMQEDEPEVQEVVDVVTTAKLITEVVTAASESVTAASTTIAAAEPQVPAAIITVALSKDKGKRIMVEEPKPLKKKQQVKIDEEYARKLHEELNKDIDWNVAIDHTKEQLEEEENRAIQSINETPAQKAAKRRKPDGQAQVWKNQRTVHGQAKVKSWKLLESCGVHIITFTTTQLILLVERRYPFSRFTLDQMLNAVRLRVEEQSEMSLKLLRRTIDHLADGKIRDRNAKESWALLEDLALYDNESWNDPRDFAKPVKEITLPQYVPSTSDRCLVKLESQVQRLMEAHLAPKSYVQVNKIASSCEICSGPHVAQNYIENLEQAFVDYASSCTDKAGGKWFTFKPEQNNLGDTYNPSWKIHPNLRFEADFKQQQGEMTNKNRHSLEDKYVESLELGKNWSAFIQGNTNEKMKDPGLFTLPCSLEDSKTFKTLADLGYCVNLIPLYLFKKLKIRLLEEANHVFGLADGTKSDSVRIVKNVEVYIGRGFLATGNAVTDYRKAKIAIREGVTRLIFGVKEIDLGEDEVPY
nr:MAK10-like protein [Tanacetum cinerariifolium]